MLIRKETTDTRVAKALLDGNVTPRVAGGEPRECTASPTGSSDDSNRSPRVQNSFAIPLSSTCATISADGRQRCLVVRNWGSNEHIREVCSGGRLKQQVLDINTTRHRNPCTRMRKTPLQRVHFVPVVPIGLHARSSQPSRGMSGPAPKLSILDY